MIAFFGRFHVLAVHLPIGVIVVAAAIEAAATRVRWRDRADGVLGPILGAAFASALLACLLGTALALEGGRAHDLVELHRWLALGTVGASAIACGAWWLHRKRGVSRWVHRGALASLVLALSAAAHVGGSLTHGESYLVELAPARVQRWLGRVEGPAHATPPEAVPVLEPTLFEASVLPMLIERCGACHGATAAKSGLRLDSYDAIVKGGRGGPGIVVGRADASAVISRIEKPLSDDDHMPPADRPQVTDDELTLLRFWIDRGASRELRLRDVLVPDGARSLVASAVARAGVAAPPLPSSVEPAGASSAPAVSAAPAASAAPSAGAAPEVDPFAALVAESAAKTAQGPAQSPTGSGTMAPSPTTDAPKTDAPMIQAPTIDVATTGPSASWEAVAPIFASRCGGCHGATKQKAKLRTDSIDALVRGGSGGPAVVLGNAKRGTLLERVHLAPNDPMHMPPEEEPQLTAAEVRLIEQWIAAPKAAAKTPPAPSSAAGSAAVAPSAPSSEGPAEGAPSAKGSPPTPPSAAPSTGPASVGSQGPEAAPPPLVAPGPGSEPAPSGGCASCRAAPSEDARHTGVACAVLLAGALHLRRRLRRRAEVPAHGLRAAGYGPGRRPRAEQASQRCVASRSLGSSLPRAPRPSRGRRRRSRAGRRPPAPRSRLPHPARAPAG